MKICRFDGDFVGLVEGDDVSDITELAREIGLTPPSRPLGDPLIMILPKIIAALKGTARKFPRKKLSGIKLMSPVFLPTKIMGAGANYKAHRAEMENNPITAQASAIPDTLEAAGLLLKATSSLVGPSEGIAVRFPNLRTDHELELVAVIGRTASNVGKAQALDYVAGYCLGLDISIRGTQFRSLRKSVDTYTAAGPWLVTADEIPDPDNLRIKLSLNGEVRQDTSTSDLISNTATLIAYASAHYTLHPGDMMYTGTPSGVGPIKGGDVLKLEGEKLGSFETVVRAYTH